MLSALQQHILHIGSCDFIAIGINAWSVKSYKVILISLDNHNCRVDCAVDAICRSEIHLIPKSEAQREPYKRFST